MKGEKYCEVKISVVCNTLEFGNQPNRNEHLEYKGRI